VPSEDSGCGCFGSRSQRRVTDQQREEGERGQERQDKEEERRRHSNNKAPHNNIIYINSMAENNEITAVPSPSSSSSDPPTEQKVKKKKFLNLFGIIKSKDKKDKEALKVPDRNSKDDKKNDIKNLFKPPAEGAITDRGEEKKEEKKSVDCVYHRGTSG